MFDLVDILKKNQAETETKEVITSVLFYQTMICRDLVMEAYRFEGVSAPEVLTNDDLSISDHVRQQSIEIVIVELNDSKNVTHDAERISHLLPSHASVIVIGSEDAISTIRNLKEMGFYYLFWPISKQELIDFVKSVNSNRQWNRGPGQKRRAKRVSVVGSKGGVGTTLLVAEIANQLVSDKKSSCVVVDHSYTGGNIDIMMGLTNFEKRRIQKGALLTALDLSTAKSLLIKQNDMLNVLSLTSEDLDYFEISEYTESVAEMIASEVNFIVDDISGPTQSLNAASWLRSDCVILVFTTTVSSLRDVARIKVKLDAVPDGQRPRVLYVLNNTAPERFATVDLGEVTRFLKISPDVIIPFTGTTGKLVLEGKRLTKSGVKSSAPIKKLVSLILGEQVGKRSLFSLLNLLGKGRQ
jgi:pilus assembly protein CpaE